MTGTGTVERALGPVTVAALVVLLVTAGLPWLGLGLAGRLPVLAAAVIWAAVAARRRTDGGGNPFRPSRRVGAVIGLVAAIVAVGFVGDLIGDGPRFEEGMHRRLLTLASVGAAVYAIAAWAPPAAYRLLRWVGPLTSAAVVGLLGSLWIRAGLDPTDAVIEAVDTGALRPILRSVALAHATIDDGWASASIRHVELRAILVASAVTLVTTPHGIWRRARWTPFAIGALGVVVTLSRANLLALGIASLVGVGVAVARLDRRQQLLVASGVLLCTVGLAVTPVVQDGLLDGSTQSSEVRSAGLGDAIERLGDAVPFGLGADVTDSDGEPLRSPHSLVLDLWLALGPIAALAGVGLVLVAVHGLVATLRLSSAGPDVGHAVGLVLLWSIVVIRFLTAGGGITDPVTWFAFGFALAAERPNGGPGDVVGDSGA